ncbi:hypothetical protein ACWEOE_40805 [Amycolatopsis sp. NPDC004368]
MGELTRRGVLGGAVAATALVGLAVPAAAAARTEDPVLESGHATPRVMDLVTRLFRDKTSRSVDRTMAHFARKPMYYTDATLGWYLPTADALRAVFEQYMPTWPATARSYATRIIGDEHSAIVQFTDSPELFGHEIRILAAVDFRDGKVIRQVDYWDGRHFGIEAAAALRVPPAQFPRAFGEDVIASQSSSVVRQVAVKLNAGLGRGDVTGLFTDEAVFEDLALRTRIVGRQAIEQYVTRAAASLPYGRGAAIRHTVGSAHGGGYEWVNHSEPVDHGIIAVELDAGRRISRFTTTWDGSQLDDHTLAHLLAATVER